MRNLFGIGMILLFSISSYAQMKIDRKIICTDDNSLTELEVSPTTESTSKINFKMYNLLVDHSKNPSVIQRGSLVYDRDLTYSEDASKYLDKRHQLYLAIFKGKGDGVIYANLEIYKNKNSSYPDSYYDNYDCK